MSRRPTNRPEGLNRPDLNERFEDQSHHRPDHPSLQVPQVPPHPGLRPPWQSSLTESERLE
jgi:hypothetical protein